MVGTVAGSGTATESQTDCCAGGCGTGIKKFLGKIFSCLCPCCSCCRGEASSPFSITEERGGLQLAVRPNVNSSEHKRMNREEIQTTLAYLKRTGGGHLLAASSLLVLKAELGDFEQLHLSGAPIPEKDIAIRRITELPGELGPITELVNTIVKERLIGASPLTSTEFGEEELHSLPLSPFIAGLYLHGKHQHLDLSCEGAPSFINGTKAFFNPLLDNYTEVEQHLSVEAYKDFEASVAYNITNPHAKRIDSELFFHSLNYAIRCREDATRRNKRRDISLPANHSVSEATGRELAPIFVPAFSPPRVAFKPLIKSLKAAYGPSIELATLVMAKYRRRSGETLGYPFNIMEGIESSTLLRVDYEKTKTFTKHFKTIYESRMEDFIERLKLIRRLLDHKRFDTSGAVPEDLIKSLEKTLDHLPAEVLVALEERAISEKELQDLLISTIFYPSEIEAMTTLKGLRVKNEAAFRYLRLLSSFESLLGGRGLIDAAEMRMNAFRNICNMGIELAAKGKGKDKEGKARARAEHEQKIWQSEKYSLNEKVLCTTRYSTKTISEAFAPIIEDSSFKKCTRTFFSSKEELKRKIIALGENISAMDEEEKKKYLNEVKGFYPALQQHSPEDIEMCFNNCTALNRIDNRAQRGRCQNILNAMGHYTTKCSQTELIARIRFWGEYTQDEDTRENHLKKLKSYYPSLNGEDDTLLTQHLQSVRTILRDLSETPLENFLSPEALTTIYYVCKDSNTRVYNVYNDFKKELEASLPTRLVEAGFELLKRGVVQDEGQIALRYDFYHGRQHYRELSEDRKNNIQAFIGFLHESYHSDGAGSAAESTPTEDLLPILQDHLDHSELDLRSLYPALCMLSLHDTPHIRTNPKGYAPKLSDDGLSFETAYEEEYLPPSPIRKTGKEEEESSPHYVLGGRRLHQHSSLYVTAAEDDEHKL
jgi:hypothetical protein